MRKELTQEEMNLAVFEKELRQIRGEMMNDVASYPSWFQYGGQRFPNSFWPRNELIKEKNRGEK